MSDEASVKLIPASLYEIIAYFGSGTTALVLFVVGFGDRSGLVELLRFSSALDAPEKVFSFILLAILTYSYGQLASACSGWVIGGPVKWAVRKFGGERWAAFKVNYTPLVDGYGLSGGLEVERVNNKWTLYFYVLAVQPELGRDLLKRYAREKLARINALNMAVLAAASISSLLLAAVGGERFVHPHNWLRWPPWWFALMSSGLSCAFAYEYFKRKCWNGDLLLKVFPAVAAAEGLSFRKPGDGV